MNRIAWIDILKGFLLLLTCSSHFMECPQIVSRILSYVPTYYVPMFFIVSGYLCKSLPEGVSLWGGVKNLFVKKIRSLFIPYFFFVLIAIFHSLGEYSSMLYQAFYLGSGCGIATPMWFVARLFMVSLIFIPVVWLFHIEENKIKAFVYEIFFMVVMSFIWIMIKDIEYELPWRLKDLPFYGVLFVGGATIRKYQDNMWLLSSFAFLLLMALGCSGFFFPILGTIFALICPLSLTFALIVMFSSNERLKLIRCHWLQWLSVNGIIVLGAHNFLYCYYHFFGKHISFISSSDSIFFCYSFILVYLTLYFIVVPFMNTYCYSILGKRKMKWIDNFK